MIKIFEYFTKKKCFNFWGYCCAIGYCRTDNYKPTPNAGKNTIHHFYLVFWNYNLWVSDIEL